MSQDSLKKGCKSAEKSWEMRLLIGRYLRLMNDDANAGFFVTRVAWDEIWNREALSDSDRSLINLGMIAALNRPYEFKGHVGVPE